MNDDEVIARQARKIEQLEKECADRKAAMEDAIGQMVCIGGPLNDNVKGYTKEQRQDFHRIENILQDWERP